MSAVEIERLAAEVAGRYVSPCRPAVDHAWWCDIHEHRLNRERGICDVAVDALDLAEDAIRATLEQVTP